MIEINDKDKALIVSGQVDKVYKDYLGARNRIFGDLQKSKNLLFENVKITGGGLADTKYAYGFRIGYSGQPDLACDGVYFDNVDISGFGPPSSNYNSFNRDGVAVERANKNILVKNSRFDGFTDACWDCKSNVQFQHCLFRDAYRLQRVWSGVTNIYSDCTFELASTTNKFFWIDGPTANVILYNCKFTVDGNYVLDSFPGTYVDLDNGATLAQIKTVTSNPLTDPFFNDNDLETRVKHLEDLVQILGNDIDVIVPRLQELERWRKS